MSEHDIIRETLATVHRWRPWVGIRLSSKIGARKFRRLVAEADR